MQKLLILAISCVAGFSAVAHSALAGECTPGLFMRVQSNLEWTINNPGPKACVFEKMQKKGKNAYEAFADCNSAFRDGGLVNPIHNDYKDCAAHVCNWFVANKYTPAC